MNENLKSCGNPGIGMYESGCRCHGCRMAKAAYDESWAPADRGMVGEREVAEARERVASWLRSGVPLREASRATGIDRNALRTLLTGKHQSKRPVGGAYEPSKRMSRANYERIMSTDAPLSPRPGQAVDSRSAKCAIRWLLGHGVSMGAISDASGVPERTLYSMMERGTCRYGTLSRIAAAAVKLKAMAVVECEEDSSD